MRHATKVLLVTKDAALEETLVELLLRSDCAVDHVHGAGAALASWGLHGAPDFAIADGRMAAGELRELLGGLDRTNARVVLLSHERTPEDVRMHHAVVRVVPSPWTMRTLMKLIDWMDGEDPNALRAERTKRASVP